MTAPDAMSDGLAAALIQISAHAERISSLDAREAGHFEQIAATPARPRQRGHHQSIPAGGDPGQPRRPRRPGRQARHPSGRPRRTQRGRRRHRSLPAGPTTPVVETQRARTRGGAGPAPRLGRADLPARLRPASRHPAALLGTPPGLPVHPRLAQRTVVRALPGFPARRAHPRRPG